MTLPSVPIVNAGSEYVNGMQLSYVTPAPAGYVVGKTLLIQPGAARDSLNTNDILLPQVVVYAQNPPLGYIPPPTPLVVNGLPVGALINANQVGANGIDAGVLAVNSMYAVYVIASSNSPQSDNIQIGGGILNPEVIPNRYPVAGMLALASKAVPALPFGYDMYRRIGWAATDSASNLVNFWQYDVNDQARMYYWDVGVSVLAAGTSAAFPSVALNTNLSPGAGIAGVAVPPMVTQVLLDVTLSAAATVQFRPFGSLASAGQVRFESSGAGGAITSMVVPSQLNAGVPTIQYAVSAGNTSVLVTGFVDYL